MQLMNKQKYTIVTEVRLVVTFGITDWKGFKGNFWKFYILIKVIVTQVFTYVKIHQAANLRFYILLYLLFSDFKNVQDILDKQYWEISEPLVLT